MTATFAWKSHTQDPKVASYRLRTLKTCEQLQKQGVACEPFNHSRAQQYKCVIFQKTFTANDIELAKRLKKNNCITALDICDNHFYNPDKDPTFTKRAERLKEMIETVDYVIVSTATLAEYIEKDKSRIFQIDDYIDAPGQNWLNKLYCNYALTREFKKHKLTNTFKIVWYGNAGIESQQFGMCDLELVIPDLVELNRKIPVSLTVISNNTDKFKQYVGKEQPFPTLYISWKKQYFTHQLPHFDACIIPARINPFTRVKTNNRVLLALQLGLPVIASPLPSYTEFEPFIAFENWQENLEKIAQYPQHISQKVKLAQEYIQQQYSTEKITHQWLDFFSQLSSTIDSPTFTKIEEGIPV